MRRRAVRRVVCVGALAVVVVVVVVVAAGGGRGSSDLSIGRIEARVQAIRGLRFVRAPAVELIGDRSMYELRSRLLPAASEIGARASEFVRPVPAAELPLIERLESLELLGAVPRGTTLQTLLFGGLADPGGLLDPRTGKIYVRRSTMAPGGVPDVLAHELTHALEFQHGLHRRPTPSRTGFDFDSLEASQSLIEGPATLLMYIYGKRFLGFRGGLEQFLSQLQDETALELPLPPFIRAAVLFPYIEGARHTNTLVSAGGWSAVTAAERHPPQTTQELLQSDHVSPQLARVDVSPAFGAGWHAEPPVGLGDFDTAVLLQRAQLRPVAWIERAWRAGSIQLWQDLKPSNKLRCQRPCAAHYALVASWRWSSTKTATRAATALHLYLSRTLGVGGQRGRTRLGSVGEVETQNTATTLVLTPDQTLTEAVAHRLTDHTG